jgi:hypothetical protein
MAVLKGSVGCPKGHLITSLRVTLQRLAGNQAVQELLGVQRHALNLDELTDESIEQDLPVQQVAFATPTKVPLAEHNRLMPGPGADITQSAQAAFGELAATGGGTNKAARHVGAARPSGAGAAGPSRRFPMVLVEPGSGGGLRHPPQAVGGGLQTLQQFGVAGAKIIGLGVRDLAAANRPLMRKILVHEAVHQMQWEQNVQQDQTIEDAHRWSQRLGHEYRV